ncbi:MaoC/PaaZ C-terminal domain-containing protein [Sulfobacillus harzensis]|uniref:Dehydratase n=1 Tax=Sulfobacillus harzensis TaxID=2729629 RepID=A0A7Y0L0L8_9FIRM|nr:MaoC/PaaZ C-terminal domain-containing protein [Sulfobacillus harzensis]NMP21087.1 dehydratase [Sulfobacillus harzensis]
MQVGDEFGPFQLSVSREQLVRYAGASEDFNPIHYDDEAARRFGLPGVIVHGMLNMGLVARFVLEEALPQGTRVEHYQVRFRSMVQPGDQLEVRARVRNMDNQRVSLDVSLASTGEKPAVQGKMDVVLP